MSAGRPFRGCACFFTDNIFVGRFGLHVRYRDGPQLRRDHGRALRERGCRSEEQFRDVLREVEAEVQRRKQLTHQSAEHRAIISKCYKPKHPEVYTLQDSFLAPEFLEIERFCTSPGADLQGLLSYLESFSDKRIYRLPVFTEQFCQALVDELENFEQSDMPKGRPNTMNNYGVLLNELGMDEPFLTPLRERLLPITALLYPELGGACLDSHKAFVVKYSLHEDLDLSSHYDNAEVTLNVSLGKEFTEGNLYFGDFNQVLSTSHSPLPPHPSASRHPLCSTKHFFTSDSRTCSVPSPFSAWLGHTGASFAAMFPYPIPVFTILKRGQMQLHSRNWSETNHPLFLHLKL
ncbi:2-oxoglutarate and iron-dependent oxygenase domain-containing protein 2 isoform X1 [Vidua chalybeata]|uniref:2-oxoglutarate and iron-dependent oxygenase domain-containing protein 2 isoform X1 n=1 Tax=Vidua chalybeata TaxID=81927 RepID=UPI0023A8CEB3|nr:2-oxoglutarate and iron-dependent oxygenase domain-containing protein 2 isoform X1 [Vidua chalybeata]